MCVPLPRATAYGFGPAKSSRPPLAAVFGLDDGAVWPKIAGMKPVLPTLFVALIVPLAAVASTLPPGEDGAKAALEKSPRHAEWVDVARPDSDTPLRCYLVFPETSAKAPLVIVIHEIFGLTDWIRAVADQLAADGFIAIAPDLLSGRGPGGGGTEAIASRDDIVRLVRELQPDLVVAMLEAVRAHGLELPACNGKSAVIGFCWGGAMVFHYAIAQPALDAGVIYYGTNPSDPHALGKIRAPLLGLYGEDDARVNTTIEPCAEQMKKLGKSYDWHIYQKAGHGFLRAQNGRDGANRRAAEQAWPVTIRFLRQSTSP
jgi:carboxymethylenebutenolidase